MCDDLPTRVTRPFPRNLVRIRLWPTRLPLHYHCSHTPPIRCAFPLTVTDESPTDIPHHNNIHSVIRELSGGILWRNHPEIIMKNSIFSIRLEHQYSPSPGKLYKVNIKKSQMKSLFLIELESLSVPTNMISRCWSGIE